MPNTLKLTTLPGGLRVATCEMPHVQTAAMGIWASVGGRHEPKALNGISHFIEHMLFKGTARRSARKIVQEIEGVGGDLNAYTSEERTCYYATAAAEYFPRICDVLSDLYLSPKFAKSDIDRERGVIAEEIQMYRDEPSSHVQELLNSTFWPGHALGRPLTGTVESIEAMGREEMLAYRASHYHAVSTVVSAAGNIRHDDVVRRVEMHLGSLAKNLRKPKAVRAPIPAARSRMAVEVRDIQQTQVAMAVPAFSHRDERRYALHLLHILLGGNASSRLFQELREKRGICYSVSTHPMLLDDTGLLNVSIGLDRKNLERSLGLIFEQFHALRERLVGVSELKRAKEYAIGSSRMSLERTSTQNMRTGSSVLVYGKILDTEMVHEHLRAVSAEEVRSVANEVLNPAAVTLAMVGPKVDEAMLERMIGI